jgi:hypothetical protein
MATTDSELADLFLASSRSRLVDQHWPRLKACVEPLTVEQIWWRPNEASNSVGNLILHLNGNVTQWILTGFTHGEDSRDRPAEFSADGGLTAAELLDRLGATIAAAEEVLNQPEDSTLSSMLWTISASTLARLLTLPRASPAKIWASIRS